MSSTNLGIQSTGIKFRDYENKGTTCKNLWKQQLRDLGMNRVVQLPCNCIRNNYLHNRLSYHATTAFQEMQWITHFQSTTVTDSYEDMKLNITSHDRRIKMPNLAQQSLWEGGPSLHTEMLDTTHVEALRSEVTLCIKKADRLHKY